MALLRRVSTIGGWTLCSRLLGLLRDRLLAGAFGASLQLDAFLLAFSLPNLLRNLFGEGALAAAFVPRYVQARAENADAAERFAGLVLSRLAALLGLIAAAGMIAAAWIAWRGPADWQLVAMLALPQLPYLIFICLAAIAAGVLNGRGRFAVPAAAPVLLNLVLIGTVLSCPGIHCLPWGVLAAGILQFGLHLLALHRCGAVPRPAWRSTPALRELRGSLLPTVVASSIYQLNALFDSLIAFALIDDGGGAVTVLYCANRLLLFPMALIGHGVGTAVYPELATAAPQGYAASTAVLRRSSRLLLALILPAAVGLFLVAEPVVRTIYQTGAFDAVAATRTSQVTMVYAALLLPVSMNKLVLRLFHAHRDQRTPMLLSLGGVAVNLGLNLILVTSTDLQELGLALASVVAALVVGLGLVLILRRRGGGLPWCGADWWRPLLATVVMGLGVLTLDRIWAEAQAPALRLLALVGLGGLIYLGLMGRRIIRRG